MTSATPLGQRAPWVATLVVLTTLGISAIRGLGNESYGWLPALGQIDAVKFIDPLLLLVLGGVAILKAVARGTLTFPVWKVRWAACVAIVLGIGIAGALLARVPPYYALQSLWFVLRPALLLLILTAARWDRRGSIQPWSLVVVFVLANAAVVLVQWVAARGTGDRYSEDAFIGLFHDAHQQATFGYTAALLSLAVLTTASTWPRRLLWMAMTALNILVGFVSQGQKATGVEAGALLLAVAIGLVRSRARLRQVVALAPFPSLAILLVVVLSSGAAVWTRAEELVSGNLLNRLEDGGYRGAAFLQDLGVVRMLADFWQLSAADPRIVFVGAGPSNFGSPAALARVDQGTALPVIQRLFWWEATREQALAEAGELRLLGLSAKTSLVGVLLGEYGCVALLAFLYLLLWPLTLAVRGSIGEFDTGAARRLFWLKIAYFGLVAQSVVSTLGAWDNDVVVTILIAGFAAFLVPGNTTR